MRTTIFKGIVQCIAQYFEKVALISPELQAFFTLTLDNKMTPGIHFFQYRQKLRDCGSNVDAECEGRVILGRHGSLQLIRNDLIHPLKRLFNYLQLLAPSL